MPRAVRFLLRRAIPRSSRGVTDVHDPHLTRFDSPVNQVWMATHRKHACCLLACGPADLRMLSDQVDRFLDRTLDIARAPRAPLINVIKDRLQVGA